MASSIWEEFKDLFKTEEQKAKEKQEKINNALNAESDVVSKLQELEKEYNDSLPKEEEYDLEKLFPSDSGLKEIEYTPRSDKDIEKSAKNEISYDKYNARDEVERKFQSAQKALEDGKSEASENLQESYANLAKLYDELRNKAQDDSLKRGMARSSVITTQLNDLSKAHMAAAGAQEKAYLQTVADIDGNIAELQRDRESALENLDIKYAIELDDRINELKAERDATVKEYEKYNNGIREKNAEYAKDREKEIAQFLKDKEKEKLSAQEQQREYEKKYGYSGEKLENYAKRYEIAYDFYKSLSPDIAVAALQASPNMKYYLGEFYSKLLSVLQSDESSQTKRYF